MSRRYDDLYWLATVKKRNDDGTFWVSIENGDNERALPAEPYHILPYSRKVVFEGSEDLVTDGHSLIPGLGVRRRRRRRPWLSFAHPNRLGPAATQATIGGRGAGLWGYRADPAAVVPLEPAALPERFVPRDAYAKSTYQPGCFA